MIKNKFASLLALLLAASTASAGMTGSSNQVMRIPGTGGIGKYGAIDLSQSAAVGTSILPEANGGTGASVIKAPDDMINIGLSASVGSSALTLALKQNDGSTNCSATAPCKVAFRSATATSGLFNQRSVTGALSIVIPSSATLGHASGYSHYIWVYLLDNAGTPELAVSTTLYEDQSVQSTTTISAAATANNVIYSTTGRSNVPVRVIARLTSNQVTAGTWAAVPTQIALKGSTPFKDTVFAKYVSTGAQSIPNGTNTIVNYDTKIKDSHNMVTTGAGTWKFTAPIAGEYTISVTDTFANTAWTVNTIIYHFFNINGATQGYYQSTKIQASFTDVNYMNGSITIPMAAGDYYQTMVFQNNGGAKSFSAGTGEVAFTVIKTGDL